jgi:hypothetical protein
MAKLKQAVDGARPLPSPKPVVQRAREAVISYSKVVKQEASEPKDSEKLREEMQSRAVN